MCGRLNLTASGAELAEAFALDEVPALTPRYNIAPTQPIAAVRVDPRLRRRSLGVLRWGLVPSWAEDPAVGSRMINARAESAASRPAFREAIRRRRCLIPTTGFYEWRKRGKQPYVIRRKDHRPFAFAGLWELWRRKGGDALETCAILTTDANALVAPIHDRMPVIVAPEAYDLWLDPRVEDVGALRFLMAPTPAGPLEAVPISSRVNAPQNDDADVLRPVDLVPPEDRQRRLF